MKTERGQLYLEPSSIFGCLRTGAKFTPRKRGTLQPVVAATVQVHGDRILVDRWLPAKLEAGKESDGKPVYLDVRTVRSPATGGRNVRYRVAVASGWQLSFTAYWDNTVVSQAEMEAVTRDAERFVGLGDGRAIGFGRFDVLRFQIGGENNAKKQATKGSLGRNVRKGLEPRRT